MDVMTGGTGHATWHARSEYAVGGLVGMASAALGQGVVQGRGRGCGSTGGGAAW
jgi:hypothetical protein